MRRMLAIALIALSSLLVSLPARSTASTREPRIVLPGLTSQVRITRDSDGIPTIVADNDHDMAYALGYANAEDRLFQMDLMRHEASGTLAEVLGPRALQSDIVFRMFGIKRSAEESLPLLSTSTRRLLDAYAEGVNAFLASDATQLPPEYAALELTKASVRPWTALDSLILVKRIYFLLAYDQSDINNTVFLAAFQQAGAAGGFDGTKLYFDDVMRCAPFDPSVTVPGFLPDDARPAANLRREMIESARELPRWIRPETIRLAERFMAQVAEVPALRDVAERPDVNVGSNWWVVSPGKSVTGHALFASDPHLPLTMPAIWTEAHLVVTDDPERGPLNVAGVQLPGTPAVALGSNPRVAWSATTNPMDLTDFYQEQFVIDAQGRPATVFEGRTEPLTVLTQQYRVNGVGDGRADNIADSGIGPGDPGGTLLLSPRRNNGPLLFFNLGGGTTAISLQYAGMRAGREIEFTFDAARARNLDEFKAAILLLDHANQNIAYADVDGNIAYFTGGEVPLREDLQTLGRPDGLPPFLIRDGTHANKNEWMARTTVQPGQSLEYEIIPFDEMPQVVNPEQGYIANANQDPVGTNGDNDPINQTRPDGGAYYLNFRSYEPGFRMGRITRLFDKALANGGKVSVNDMIRFQANHQMLDADVFVPYILQAYENARARRAPAALKAFASDKRLKKVAKRLARWDSSTPTGIEEGYDPGDDPNKLPAPTKAEIRNSTMATVYSVWRSRIVANTVDATLARVGLGGFRTSATLALVELRNLLDNFATSQGKGESSVDFFVAEGATTPEVARDVVILKSLQEALDLLASPAFAPAFGGSTDIDDYRWGRIHRIVFAHPFGQPFSVPSAGGFAHLTTELPGVAKSGGYATVDVATHLIRGVTPAEYMFAHGASRRFIAEMAPNGPVLFEIIPGGQSGVVTDPNYASQMGRWLTNRYLELSLSVDLMKATAGSHVVLVPASDEGA